MIAIEISHIRNFMNKLLLSDVFDTMLVSEISITTYATFHIDGHLHPEFFDDHAPVNADDASDMHQSFSVPGQPHTLATWAQLKKHCLAVIRGSRTPLAFQIVFQLPPSQTARLIDREALPVDPEEVRGLFFNCRFRSGSLQITSGTSLAYFDTGKLTEHAWDNYLTAFLNKLDLT